MAKAKCPITAPPDDRPRSLQPRWTCGRLLRRSPSSFAGLGILLLSSLCCAQTAANPPQFPNSPIQPIQPAPGEGDAIYTEMRLKQIQAVNKERYRRMVSDAEKLLKLTAELNAQINSAHPSNLTARQLHVVDEIAKLAHNIREIMVNPVGMPMIPPVIAPPAGQGNIFPGQSPTPGIYGR